MATVAASLAKLLRQVGSTDPERLLDATEAGALVGFDPEHVRRLVRAGRIPALKIGQDVRIRRADLLAWANGHPYVRTSPPAAAKQKRTPTNKP